MSEVKRFEAGYMREWYLGDYVHYSDYTALAESHERLRVALVGVIRVADRDTDEFNAARDALAKAVK